ncbi:PEP-CTERM sorting domain-containing protein [Verrucomicrobiaceae bacterium R5-34]|nr:PEP-CTERM sorting domain-containing protein [Verrucomicrobiaceae bacterium R5-34]
MNTHTTTLLLGGLLVLPAQALTIFTGIGDFNTAGNWDNGLPDASNGPGEIAAGATATMSADYIMLNNSPSVTDIVVKGTLNTGANELQLRSGTVSSNPDIFVDGGTINVNLGGTIDVAGASADVFITNGGTLSFEDGSTAQISKALEVISGSLNLSSGTSWSGNLGDELVIGDAGILSFSFDSSLNHLTIPGSSLALELGDTSTLALNFAAAPTTGDSYTLVNNVSGFGGAAGVFGNVNASGLGAGQSLEVVYNTTDGLLQVQVVPEPSSTALLGLGGIALLLRRRR